MSGRQSSAVDLALRLLAETPTMTITEAANRAQVARTSVNRALRRAQVPPRPATGRPVREYPPLPEPYRYDDGSPL